MQVSVIARRARVLGSGLVVAFGAQSCHPPETYPPVIVVGGLPLPAGVPSDPAAFRALVGGRIAGPTHHRTRFAEHCVLCTVDVEIGPLGNTMEVDPHPPAASPMPTTGRAVAKLINNDPSRTEEMYKLAPKSQREYYIWADTSNGTTRITLLSVPALGLPGNVEATFQKHLKICKHTHNYPKMSDADFKWCPGVTVADKGSYLAASMGYGPLNGLLAVLLRALTVETPPPPSLMPIWLECLSGCCG